VCESYATRATPTLLCHVALLEKASGRYVRARGADVGLSEEVGVLRATSRFALYEKRPHLLGLRSTVSGKYVGITFSGAIQCAASSFGRWEEFDLDLQRPHETPMLCVAANWGGGCWIRVQPNRERRLVPAEPRGGVGAVPKKKHTPSSSSSSSSSQRAYDDRDDEAAAASSSSSGRRRGASSSSSSSSSSRTASFDVDAPSAVIPKQAARFEIVVLDDVYQAPAYAEEVLRRVVKTVDHRGLHHHRRDAHVVAEDPPLRRGGSAVAHE